MILLRHIIGSVNKRSKYVRTNIVQSQLERKFRFNMKNI